jgi:uncharacterized protein YneF (UPF0154 family)
MINHLRPFRNLATAILAGQLALLIFTILGGHVSRLGALLFGMFMGHLAFRQDMKDRRENELSNSSETN